MRMAAGGSLQHNVSVEANGTSIDAVIQLRQSHPAVSSAPAPSASPSDVGAVGDNVSASSRTGFHSACSSTMPVVTTGVDTSSADLTYRRDPCSSSLNNPSSEGWLYPHKKGMGTGSNLEAFRTEIEARTQRGENCKTIADALVAMGVQTSDKAISRVRIKWGMRQRAQRKVKTPPPNSEAARLSAKSKVQALRKVEITRMTKEGMTAEEIYENLTSRGMKLRKGVATVLRLQSAWRLTHDEKRWVENFRHQCHRQAKAQQAQAFKDIVEEIPHVQDVDVWLEYMMSTRASRELRHEHALKLMGRHAPANPERRRLQNPRNAPALREDGSDQDLQDIHSDPGFEASTHSSHNASGDHPNRVSGYTELNDQMDDDPHRSDSAPCAATQGFVYNDRSKRGSISLQKSMSILTPSPSTPAAATTVGRHSANLTPRRVSKSSTFRPTATLDLQNGPIDNRKTQPPMNPMNQPALALAFGAPSTHDSTHLAPSSAAQPHVTVLDDADMPFSAEDLSTPTATLEPMLVLCLEEVEANKAALSTLDQQFSAAQTYKSMLQARIDNKPMLGSLTGLPPSSKQVGIAKRKLKETTRAMVLMLE